MLQGDHQRRIFLAALTLCGVMGGAMAAELWRPALDEFPARITVEVSALGERKKITRDFSCRREIVVRESCGLCGVWKASSTRFYEKAAYGYVVVVADDWCHSTMQIGTSAVVPAPAARLYWTDDLDEPKVLETFTPISDKLAKQPRLMVGDASVSFERLADGLSVQPADGEQARIGWVPPEVPAMQKRGRILVSMQIDLAPPSIWRRLPGLEAPANDGPAQVFVNGATRDAFGRVAIPVPGEYLGNNQWVPRFGDAGVVRYFVASGFTSSRDILFWISEQQVMFSGGGFRPGPWTFVYDPASQSFFHLRSPVALSIF